MILLGTGRAGCSWKVSLSKILGYPCAGVKKTHLTGYTRLTVNAE